MPFASSPTTDLRCTSSYSTCMIYGLLACIIDSTVFVPAVFCYRFRYLGRKADIVINAPVSVLRGES